MGHLDRYGEEIRDTEPADLHAATCRDGWLGEDKDGRPIPCLTCRPHILRRRK